MGISTSLFCLAYLYSLFPLTFTAEYLGGCCLDFPSLVSKNFLISSLRSTATTSSFFVTSDIMSSVSDSKPKSASTL